MKNNIFAYFFVIFVLAMYLSLSVLISTICYPIKYFDDVTKCCQSYNIEYSLVLAVIKAESNFKKDAISKVGAIGLMQIMPSTAKFIADKIKKEELAKDLYNAKNNIELGTAYLSYLIKRFCYIDVAICAYNAGEGEVRNWLNENGKLKYIRYTETRLYLKKVLYAKAVYDEKLKHLTKTI